MTRDATRPAPPQEEAALEPGPSYTEAQVAQILRRAAELERGRASSRPGLSLAEVEAIARESGLDPELVRVAARSLGQKQQQAGLAEKIAGAPVRYTVEREVEGEIGTAQHEALFADLRAFVAPLAQRPPQISTVGRTLTLSARTGKGLFEVVLTPRNGKTLLRIDVSTGHLAGALFGAMTGGMGTVLSSWAAALAVHSHQPAAIVALAMLGTLGGAFTVARTVFSTNARGLYRKADELANKLEARLREELAQK